MQNEPALQRRLGGVVTALGREEKYKVKHMIDGVVIRVADATSSWTLTVARTATLDLSVISLATVPIAAG